MANAAGLNICGLKLHQQTVPMMSNLMTSLGQVLEVTSDDIKYATTWQPMLMAVSKLYDIE